MMSSFKIPSVAALLLVATTLFSGCATGRYSVPAPVQAPVAQSDKALVTIMRTSAFGAAISSSVFDITGGKTEIIGIPGPKEKIAFYCEPGEHQFMVIAENADFMDAKLEAGRIYYAIITPRMGVWKARFSLHPFKQVSDEPAFQLNSPELKKWLSNCAFVTSAPSTQEWLQQNRPGIEQKKQEYLVKWNAMLEQDKRYRRLDPQDGVSSPIQ